MSVLHMWAATARRCLGPGLLAAAASLATPAQAQAPGELLNATVQEQRASDADAARSQVRISQLADETAELLGAYRLTTQQLDRVTIYNDNLQRLIEDQQQQMASIRQQLEDFVVVEQGIVPLMLDMIEALERFVSLDVPFQLEERL